MSSRSVLLCQWESHVSGSPESARILIEGLQERGWEVTVVVGHPGHYVNEYQRLGCTVHIVPQKHWLRKRRYRQWLRDLPGSFRAFRQLRRLMKTQRPDLVYINTIVGWETASAARSCRIPVIWHIRDMFVDAGGDMHPPPLFGKRGVQWLLRRLAHQIVVVSEAVRRNVLDEASQEAVSVVFNGVHDDYFCSPRRPADNNGANTPLVIGVPGTIRPMKGQDFLIEAVARASAALGDFQVRITGEGRSAFRTLLETLVDENGLRDQVEFVGNIRRMPEFLQGCDIVVIPSVCDPLPRTVMEAMASGCAVIGTNVGGIPEMLSDNDTGMLVEYGDVEGLARCIETLAGQQDLRERLGRAAAEHARQNFGIGTYQETLCRLISQTVT